MSQSLPDPQQLRSQMYDEGDLGGLTLFSGGFINYGYWPDTIDTSRPLTVDERTRSQAELYRVVADQLGVKRDSRLLELGCGKGSGAALVTGEYSPAVVVGLDLSARQLQRAVAARPSRSLNLVRASALRLPIGDSTLDGVYCVEAAQHVDDHRTLTAEAHRVLREGGRFVVAGFFAPGGESDPRLGEMLETVGNGIDVVAPVDGFVARLAAAGFGEIVVEPIGERVWEGMDAWIAQTEYHDSWGRNWLTAYREGWVDYFLIHASAG